MGFAIIYVTHENEEAAQKVTSHLLNRRLIACANTFPIKSAYWWNGEIANEDEVVSILKTSKRNWEKVKSEIEKIHPYKVPCIIRIDVQANEDYQSWIEAETK